MAIKRNRFLIDMIAGSTLPIIVVEGVLFPGSSFKIPIKSESNIRMLKSQFIDANNIASDMLIGVFPVEKPLSTTSQQGAKLESKVLSTREASKAGGHQHRQLIVRDVDQRHFGQNLSGVHKIGTIALIVDISCEEIYENDKQTSRYSITVTGVCRGKLSKVMPDASNQNYLVARVHVLTSSIVYQAHNSNSNKNSINIQNHHQHHNSSNERAADANNHNNSELNDSFKYLRALALHMIENVYSIANKTPFETKLLFQSFAALTDEDLTDMFAAIVYGSHEEKLAILDSIELSERASRTIQLIKRHIDHIKAFQNKLKLADSNEQSVARGKQNNQQTEELGDNWNGHSSQLKDDSAEFDNSNDDNLLETDAEDHAQLVQRLRSANLPEAIRRVTSKEVARLRRMPNHMPEYAIIRGYLELVADLPWAVASEECIDLRKSKKDLDNDHHGLQKLKERVLQYLAVRKLRQAADMDNGDRSKLSSASATPTSQPILFFVGPPGTGKTSIARSIAKSLGRKFQRISLGGISDQSDIRGHRRTYIGSMPGRIIQGIKQAGVNNPIFLLDELDKVSPVKGVHGDPSSALLEVLDPEQNHSFTDHYLNVPFDLSNVLFIATANTLNNISPALLDRMEVIQVHGYTHEEKFDIARKHLIQKQIFENGLNSGLITITDDTVHKLITHYAHEPGVRNLDRKIAAVCRVVAVRIVEQQQKQLPTPVVVDAANLESFIGPPMFDSVKNPRASTPGLALGLAWTAVGGEIMFVEAEIIKGGANKDNLILTGQLGSVMRESAKLALNWIRANCHLYPAALSASLANDLITNTVHVHFPQGAVSKDGPSAGVAIVLAIVSHCLNQAIKPDLAATGEITLRGQVLRVGGIQAKMLAAHRAGIKKVILPRTNEPDLCELPKLVRDELMFHLVSTVDEAIQISFNNQLAKHPLAGIEPSQRLVNKL